MTGRLSRLWRGGFVEHAKARLIPMSPEDRRDMEQLHQHNEARRRQREEQAS